MHVDKDKIIAFLKPNATKVVIFLILIIFFFFFWVESPWGHSSTPIPVLFYLPIMFTGIFGIILFFPYTYIIACVIALLWDIIKKRKLLIIVVVVISILLFGIDEPLVNSTVNMPNYSCKSDSDCVVKSISKGWCGNPKCVNQNWNYYDSRINSVFALSCMQPLISCSCVQNACHSTDLYKSTDLQDCEKFEGSKKQQCTMIVSRNINLTRT